MEIARRERAALDAIHAESAASAEGGYEWGRRDCTTMVDGLCAALGLPLPAYGGYRAQAEARAAVVALRRYGHLGRFHRALLVEAGGWAAADGPLEAGDVVSVGCRMRLPHGAEAAPARKGLHLTGIVSGGRWWSWGAHGLEGVPVHCIPVGDELVTVTRAI